MPIKHAHILNKFTFAILILQCVLFFVVFNNISLVRQAFSFIYLLFIPGIVILRLITNKFFDIADKILFSVALSIAFLMFIGLTINVLGKIFCQNPLSTNILVFVINVILLLLTFVPAKSNNSENTLILNRTGFFKFLLLLLTCICPLLLGFYGIFLVNYSGENFLIVILILTIALIVSLTIIKQEYAPSTYHQILILVIFICFLLFISGAGYALVTPYITGLGDQWTEFHAFKLTGHYWNASIRIPDIEVASAYSMISVTILPTIFSNITGLNDSVLFKLFYPIVVSFMAISAYKLYQTQMRNKKAAFLATFYFVTISASKGVGPSKQEIALLFYSVMFLLLIRKDIPRFKKIIFMVIFGSALAISHYGLAIFFLIILLGSLLILALLDPQRRNLVQYFKASSLPYFALTFSVITFSWYIFICKSASFDKIIDSLTQVIGNLNRFLDISSRGTALQGLGFVETPSILHRISSALFIFSEILLFLGFIRLLKWKNAKFDIEYKVFAFMNFMIILLNIMLPRLADTFLMQRFYQTTLVILAPLAVVGGKWMLEFMLKRRFRRRYITILAFLIFIPLFIFQTELPFELTHGQCWAVSLVKYRTNQFELYRRFGCIDAYYYFGASWLSENILHTHKNVYADYTAQYCELRAYTTISPNNVRSLSNITRLEKGDFIYLNPPNIIWNSIIGEGFSWNTTDFHFLYSINKIYTNGGSEIYKGPG